MSRQKLGQSSDVIELALCLCRGKGHADLLKEVVHNDKHGPAKIAATEEIGPWSLVHVLLQNLSDGLNLQLTFSIRRIRIGPQMT
jgi:hypothetical protein